MHEIKHDGDRVRVFSRRRNDYTDHVPLIARRWHAGGSNTIDGEGVVCGPNGVSDFDRLWQSQDWIKVKNPTHRRRLG